MELKDNENKIIESPTEEQIYEAIYSLDLNKNEDAFLILAKEEMTYIQCCGDPKSDFRLEYQEGTIDEHYFAVGEIDVDALLLILTAYANGDESWKEDYEWERLIF